MTTGETIAKAAGAVVLMNLLSRVLGFGRETAIAMRFGASEAVDAYLVAYTIPYFLQAILGAALVTAAVPVFTKYIVEDNRAEAWKVASILMNMTFILLVIFTLVGMLGSTVLVKILAPGFNPQATALAAQMTKIMFPAVIFMGLGMLLTGILNAFRYFAIPAFAPGFSSLVIIATVLLFGVQFGIEGLAVGTVVSMVGFLLIQYPLLRKIKFKYTFSLDYNHPAVKKVGLTIMPIVIGVAVNQIYFALNRVFASGLVEGSISALNYAHRLMNLPLGIFVAAIATAIFPTLASQAIKNQRFELGQTLIRGLRLVTLIAIPATVGLIVLAEPVVELLFERGAFDHRATVMTAYALVFYSIGMFAQGANLVITRAYYAVDDVRTPVVMGLISVGVNVIFSFALIGPMAHGGLALANSIAATVNTVLLYYYLKRHIGQLPHYKLAISFAKVCLAAAIMAFITLKAYAGITGHIVLQVGGAIAVGATVYGLIVLLFKEEETMNLFNQILEKFSNKK